MTLDAFYADRMGTLYVENADGDEFQVRESVIWFAKKMERKLQTKDPDHPDGWTKTSAQQMFNHLLDEVRELHEAMTLGEDAPGWWDHIIDEAVDVGNLAHMIADRSRQLQTALRKAGFP